VKKILTFPVKLSRLKSSVFSLLAKTISGLEPILARELEALGAKDTEILNRAVAFKGEMSLMYRANYCCRTALRILKPLFNFEIKEQKDFYERIVDFPWEELLDPSQTLAVDAVISFTVFTNSQYVAQKAKDAIVDRLREKTGKRPSVDLDNPDLRINVHLFKDLCTVSLDGSGSTLNRRGYRKRTGLAPINEVLAAGLIGLAGWDRKTPFVDPMCGSGTFLIETVMAAREMPAGYFRRDYGFMKWKDFDPELWQSVREEANRKMIPVPVPVSGMDRSGRALAAALENIRAAGMEKEIRLEQVAFEDSVPPFPDGIIITNPPYDERLKLPDNVAFYQMIGNVLKRKYSGYEAWLISADMEAMKFIGLKPSRRIPVFNGPLECRFVRFNLYAGKKGYQHDSGK